MDYNQTFNKIKKKKSDDYDEKYTIKKVDTDDKLPLNKWIGVPIMIIDVWSIFYDFLWKYQILSIGFLRWMSL